MRLRASVTVLELFRIWKQEEGLSYDWLLNRIRGLEPPTESMLAGRAFHEAMEGATGVEISTFERGPYRFDFNCDAMIPATPLRELSVERMYGQLLVRGRVDSWVGREILDYKTTERFDAERLMEGYQWRYYLDMTSCDSFCWKVFVMRECGRPQSYEIYQSHTLRQQRYPSLHEDCERLAREYLDTLGPYLEKLGPQAVVQAMGVDLGLSDELVY
jgi:hypothetical protein